MEDDDDAVQLLPVVDRRAVDVDAGFSAGGAGVDTEEAEGKSTDRLQHGDGNADGDADGAGDGEVDAIATASSYDIATSQRRPLRLLELVALNAVWAWYQLFWFVLLIVAIPSQVARAVGPDDKGYAMFVIFMVGGVLNLISSILLGYLADRTYAPYGRRYTWLIGSILLLVPVTIGTAAATTLVMLTVMNGLIQIVATGVSVAFNGLVGDVVNIAQRGRASAIMGAMGMVGYIMGALLGLGYDSIGDYGMYSILAGLSLVSVGITYAVIREPPFTREDVARIRVRDAVMRSQQTRVRKPGVGGAIVYAFRWTYGTILLPLFEPLLTNRDFFWVFLTRFFIQLGQYTVQEFLQYYLDDCMELPVVDGEPMPAETAVSLFMLPMLLTATVSALVCGYLSDRWGRRRRIFIYLSGIGMVAVCIALISIKVFYVAIAVSIIFGASLGSATSIDFAIVLDTSPSKDDVARDIALWHLALVLPQIFATPFAGLLLDTFQEVGHNAGIECLGYTVIWSIAALYFALGCGLIRQVRGIK